MPSQMRTHVLDIIRGRHPHMLQFQAPFFDDTAKALKAGSCVRTVQVNGLPYFAAGVGSETMVPLFLWNKHSDPDVSNDGGDPATDKFPWVSAHPSRDDMAWAVPALACVELATTEFVHAAYVVNDHLTSAATGINAGKITKGTPYTDTICGIVSSGVRVSGVDTDAYDNDILVFWAHYIPPIPA